MQKDPKSMNNEQDQVSTQVEEQPSDSSLQHQNQVSKQREEQPADPSLQYPGNFPPTPPSGGAGVIEATIALILVLSFLKPK